MPAKKKSTKKSIIPQKPIGYALDPKRKKGPIVNRPARDSRAGSVKK
jgi:hypothetical protein